MSPSSNKEAVLSLYASFGKGDVPAILELLADDFAFHWAPGAPYSGIDHGKEAFAKNIALVPAVLNHSKFDPYIVIAEGDYVVSYVKIDTTHRASGKKLSVELNHRFTFNKDGKMVHGLESMHEADAYAALFQ
eukprot:Colp12_sorted_trinity150504_noHs@903